MIVPNPVNFVGALWRLLVAAVARKPLLVDNDTLRYRTDKCAHECPFYDAGCGQCKLCSCFVGMKAHLATETCPAKLWRKDLLNTRLVR